MGPVQRRAERVVRYRVLRDASDAQRVFGHHPAGARCNPDGVRLERRTLYHYVALRVYRIWAYRSIAVWRAC